MIVDGKCIVDGKPRWIIEDEDGNIDKEQLNANNFREKIDLFDIFEFFSPADLWNGKYNGVRYEKI